MQTYWLISGHGERNSFRSFDHSHGAREGDFGGHLAVHGDFDEKTSRLIDWNVDMVSNSIKQIIACRNGQLSKNASIRFVLDEKSMFKENGESFLDEVKETISLPDFDRSTGNKLDWEKIEIPAEAKNQLKDCVISIASMYRDNSFHNFEHAR